MRAISAHILIAFSLIVVALSGCDREPRTAPPTVLYGQDPCDVCKMIISDARYASALVVDDDGYVKKLKFDDIGCMLDARDEAGADVLTAYVNDYSNRNWLDAEQSVYVYSNQLHTPMAFGVAAFGSQDDAEQLQQEYSGDILNFDGIIRRFRAGELTINPAGGAPDGTAMQRDSDRASGSSLTRNTVQSQYSTQSCTIDGVNGDVIVALAAPESARVGKQPLEVLLLRTEGNDDALQPLAECTVSIEPHMPSMGHGSPGNENPAHVGNGRYRGMVNFTMPGEWLVQMTVQHDSAAATVEFTFEVTR